MVQFLCTLITSFQHCNDWHSLHWGFFFLFYWRNYSNRCWMKWRYSKWKCPRLLTRKTSIAAIKSTIINDQVLKSTIRLIRNEMVIKGKWQLRLNMKLYKSKVFFRNIQLVESYKFYILDYCLPFEKLNEGRVQNQRELYRPK